MYVSLFYSEEDTDTLKSSLWFLNVVLKDTREHDEDFFVDMIKLVLYTLSSKIFPQDVINKVIGSLEIFLDQITQQICQSKEFSTKNEVKMLFEIEVHTYIVIHTYITYNNT